jgi:hypothetical protein
MQLQLTRRGSRLDEEGAANGRRSCAPPADVLGPTAALGIGTRSGLTLRPLRRSLLLLLSSLIVLLPGPIASPLPLLQSRPNPPKPGELGPASEASAYEADVRRSGATGMSDWRRDMPGSGRI